MPDGILSIVNLQHFDSPVLCLTVSSCNMLELVPVIEIYSSAYIEAHVFYI